MTSSTRAAARRGFLDGLPFILTGGPFGLVFGLVAGEAGMNLFETFSMSALVMGGASQFAALAQLKAGAPVIMAVAAGLMVNLRMAIYSAALAPHLGPAPFWKRAFAAYLLVDNVYVTSVAEYSRRPDQPLADRLAYYFATSIPVCSAWVLASIAGALGGRAIPASIGIDYVVPLAFLAMLAPMFRTLAHLVAALVAVAALILLAALPYNSELLVAGVLGMAAGAEVERRRGAGRGGR